MSKKLLIINNHDSFTYNLVDLIRRLSVEFCVVDVENLQLEQVAEFSHILISPGPDVPRAYPQLFAMLERFHLEKSILGVCLGHQTLCEYFGGHLYNLPTVRHGQQHLIQHSDSPIFAHLPRQFYVGLYHSWAIATENFPAELEMTAFDGEILMAMQHRTLPIFGVQFHPESYMSEQGAQILQNWLNT